MPHPRISRDPIAQMERIQMMVQNPININIYQTLPDYYAFVSNSTSPEFQLVLDIIHSRLASTPTGQAICRKISNGDAVKMMRLFAPFYYDYYRLIAESCGVASDESTWLKLRGRQLRKFHLVIYEGSPPPYESWTNPNFETFIAIKKGQSKLEEVLLRKVAHEFAIMSDASGNWGYEENLDPFYRGPNQCEVLTVIRDPLVKYSAATLRALKIENQIMQELRLPTTELEPQGDCTNHLLRLSVLLSRFGWNFQAEELSLYQSMIRCNQKTSNLLEIQLSTLRSEKVFNGQTLCEFITTPFSQGYHLERTFNSGGPRPRIGGGSNTSKLDENPNLDQLRAAQNDRLKQALQGMREFEKSQPLSAPIIPIKKFLTEEVKGQQP